MDYDSNPILQYLQFFAHAYSQPSGQAMILIGLVLFGYILLGRRGGLLGIALLILTGIASLFENSSTSMGYDTNLSSITTNFIGMARMLFLLTLIVLTGRLATTPKGWRRFRMGAPVFSLLLLEIFFALRMLATDAPGKALLSALMACLLVSAIYAVLSRALLDIPDVQQVKRVIVLAGGAFCAISLLEYIRNPTSVLMNHRFTGISGNPQFAAIFLGFMVLSAVSLLLDHQHTSRLRRASIIIAILTFSALLLWTGSRTGVLMAVVGLVVLLRARLTRWLVIGLAALLLALIVIAIFPEVGTNLSRFTSVEDTRSANYAEAWNGFLAHPVYGDPQFVIVESSYLSVAAGLGLCGVFLLAIVVFSQIQNLIQVLRYARAFPELRETAEYVVAISCALGAAALVEGFLLGYATASIVFVYIALSLTRFATDYGEARVAESAFPQPAHSLPDLYPALA